MKITAALRNLRKNVVFVKNWPLLYLVKVGLLNNVILSLRYWQCEITISRNSWKQYVHLRDTFASFLSRHWLLVPVKKGWMAINCLDGQWLKIWAPSISLLYSILEPIQIMYPPHILEGKRILDLGAYIGDTACYFVLRCRANEVIAYEPHPLHFKILKINVAINKISRKVKTINKAVVPSLEKMYIIKGVGPDARLDNTNNKQCEVSYNDQGSQIIECETLASAIETYHPDVVKMDIEGIEKDVILYTEETFLRKVPIYIIEIHGCLAEHDIVMRLKRLGYKHKVLCRLTENISVHLVHEVLRKEVPW